MDYKKEYETLKHKVDTVMIPLINRAMCLLEDDPDEFCEKYENAIAPMNLDLPAIMTMYEPDERADAYRFIVKYIGKNGLWTGGRIKKKKDGTGGRPHFSRQTRLSKHLQTEGKRKSGTYGVQTTSGNVIRYLRQSRVNAPPSHLVLVNDQHFPTERRNVASHLCHNSLCVDVAHLEWSSSNDNQRREMCHEEGVCMCGLATKCLFGVH